MRSLLAVLALAAVAVPAAADPAASDLTFTLENVRSSEGKVVVALFASEADYKAKAQPVRTAIVPARTDRVEIAWTGLKPGAYAAVAYHDRDEDGRLNTLPIGLPTEPFAISRNAPVRFGPPTWRAAAFNVVPGANHQWARLR